MKGSQSHRALFGNKTGYFHVQFETYLLKIQSQLQFAITSLSSMSTSCVTRKRVKLGCILESVRRIKVLDDCCKPGATKSDRKRFCQSVLSSSRPQLLTTRKFHHLLAQLWSLLAEQTPTYVLLQRRWTPQTITIVRLVHFLLSCPQCTSPRSRRTQRKRWFAFELLISRLHHDEK